MRAGYQAQPYRRGRPRKATPALRAMRRGKPKFGPHPMDAKRKAMSKKRRRALMRAFGVRR